MPTILQAALHHPWFSKWTVCATCIILLSGKSEAVYRHCMSSIVQLYTDTGFNLKPDIVHVDFEESMIVRSIFPATDIKCCRFHLGQAWWRKIQKLGLPNE